MGIARVESCDSLAKLANLPGSARHEAPP